MLIRSLLCMSVLVLLHAEPRSGDDDFICPPCGSDCHELSFESEGSCPTCGMQLVPRSTVPHVAVLLYEGADVATSTGPLSVFAASGGSIVYTVADTTDPLRLQQSLTVVPKYDFESVPALDVLVVPSGSAPVWEDEVVLDWIRETADAADHVIGIGTGNIALLQAGFVADGQKVPVPSPLVRLAAEIGLEGRLSSDNAVVHSGKLLLARDASAALEASLGVVLGINGPQESARAASMLGLPERR